jgi:hypothetical protein
MSELNLDLKVEVKSLCEWDLYFSRQETLGEVKVPKAGKVRLSRSEIQAQVYAQNSMFVGIDGAGSHAKLYIEDKDTRILVGFEDADSKEAQNVITKERVQKILGYKTFKTFQEKIEEEIKLDSEKLLLVEEAKRQKLNDYDRIQFIEDYTGFKFEDKKK